jgi:hypothetical protein
LSDELAAQTVRYFLPPIIRSITRQTESSQGLLQFLEFLGERRFDRYMNDPAIFGHPHVEDHGKAILAALFPRGQQVRKIIANRTKVLPVNPQVMEAMFPYIAVLALGGIEQKTHRPLGDILQRLAGPSLDPQGLRNPYSALAREIRFRKLAARPRKVTRRTSAFSGVFGNLFARGERTAA